MRVELLSPVGNMATLYQAIHNGCDAVYLGGKNYGARKYSSNFSNDELKEAIRYAHLYGVKVYVTVNTIIFENEVKDFLEYIFYLHKINVDALIMQDIGMIKVVKEKFPNIEVHASTQCHNHNEEGIKFLKSLGVSRIVLDREMSLEDIKKLPDILEKEVFVHGALCVSYSGCCLFSSLNGGRSGNRGECTQCCRLPYTLYQNDKKIDTEGDYLLSTRELNTLFNLKDLLESGITSFKIEGRMKSPEYVGYVTKLYRKLIDAYYNKEEMIVTDEEIRNLKLLFNREFTNGYLFEANEIMNIKTPNHQGIVIGNVINVSKDKIYIKLTETLNQEDGIRFKEPDTGMMVNMLYNENMMLTNSVFKGKIAIVDNKVNKVHIGDTVLKTIDKKLIDSLKKYDEKKIGIDISVLVSNNTIAISIIDIDGNMVDTINEVEDAKNTPTSIDNIKTSLSKLGDTIYKVNNININYNQDIFIPISKLNDIRRNMLSALDEKRINKFNKRLMIDTHNEIIKIKEVEKKYNINVLVRNKEQLIICMLNDVDNIYTTDKELYNKYKEVANIYYKTPRIMNKFVDIKNGNILASELGSINKYSLNNNVNTDYTLNVCNTKSIELLNKFKVNLITLSVELTYEQIKDIMKKVYNVEVYIYGKVELMITKYCPLKLNMNHCNICKNDNNKYYLKDNKDRMYRILHNNCITSIMHYKNIDRILDIERYKNLHIYNYRVDLLDENEEEVTKLISDIRRRLN